MAQRVRKSYRGLKNRPSSATQLPILAALHAGLPTLFAINIHDSHGNVKTQMEKFSNNPGNLTGRPRGQFVTYLGRETYNSWAPRPVLPW